MKNNRATSGEKNFKNIKYKKIFQNRPHLLMYMYV